MLYWPLVKAAFSSAQTRATIANAGYLKTSYTFQRSSATSSPFHNSCAAGPNYDLLVKSAALLTDKAK
jgi:hypothetical protein